MSCPALKTDIPYISRQQVYDNLLACTDNSENGHWLAQIIASWQVGEGVLPSGLSLTDADFKKLLAAFFPNTNIQPSAPSGKTLDFSRMLEKQDLENYLRRYAVIPAPESEWLIALIVAACLGSDHLWQDLGLFSRKELSALLTYNFPQMAVKNSKDMKWKKFIYKQLCEEEGIYICRAPSCDVCQDYQHCFGSEE